MTSNYNKETLINALDDMKNQGWNGAIQYSITGLAGPNSTELQAAFVAAFNGIVSGCNRQQLKIFINNIILHAKQSSKNVYRDAMATLIIMSFQLRDHRGPGKGLRDLARWMWIEIYSLFPKTFIALLHLIPEYGYWKDLQQLIVDINELDTNLTPKQMIDLTQEIYLLYAQQITNDFKTLQQQTNDFKTLQQITNDFKTLQQNTNDFKTLQQNLNKKDKEPQQISLCAKWIPKQGRSYDKQYNMSSHICKLMYPNLYKDNRNNAMKKFRQTITKLNSAINTTETLMHDNKFSEIKFTLVPGRCFNLKRRSFLNLKGGSKNRSHLQRSNETDRIECRDNVLKYLEGVASGDIKMNVKSLFPHELVQKMSNGKNCYSNNSLSLTNEEKNIYELQFSSIFQQLQAKVDLGDINIGRMITLLDISGSMYTCTSNRSSHRPVDAAIAIAIIASRLTNGPFRNRFLGFSENPTWCKFTEDMTFTEMVDTAFSCPGHGLSTDYLACHELILKLATQLKCTPNELPDKFLVLSDMQYNFAINNKSIDKYQLLNKYNKNTNSTHHEILVEAYKQEGIKVCGQPWILPETIYWNLNGSTNGATVQADTPNTQMISGYNPKMLEIVLGGELDKLKEKVNNITPWDTFQIAMNHSEYFPIHQIITNTKEDIFNNYSPPELITDNDYVIVK